MAEGGRSGARRRTSLRSAEQARRFQRDWFHRLREEVGAGDPFAIVNADTPMEILKAMGIPYVVNQWWASLCSAKQLAPRYLELLRAHGYPDDQLQYNALGLASFLDDDPDGPPWGGLPQPTLLLADVGLDAQRKLFEAWAEVTGARFFPLERTATTNPDPRWWEHIDHDWEALLGSRRLDLLVEEMRALIAHLEATTGRRFDESALLRVSTLVNEQEEWNRRTRDLIARTVPCPIGIADGIPSVMVPQWHRGTEWARDAARLFHDEVAQRVREGAAACPGERVRLMWIGTGVWFDMGFYQHFEDRYRAVFVWSMYLAIAADGYIRYGTQDPLRTLAARWTGFTDMLGMPPWSSAWYAKEARTHQVDGVVHLVSPSNPRGSAFITEALEADGVPVLEVVADNVDARSWHAEHMQRLIGEFIERRAAPVARARAAGERPAP